MMGDVAIIKDFVGVINRWRSLVIIVVTLAIGFWATSITFGSISEKLENQVKVTATISKKFATMDEFGVIHRVRSLEHTRAAQEVINKELSDKLSYMTGMLEALTERGK